MSELFESLNFPIHPTSSPSTASTHDAAQRSHAETKGEGASSATRINKAAAMTASGDSLNESRFPQTPRTRDSTSFKSSRSKSGNSNESDYSQMMTPLLSVSSSSSTLLARPGHVFWHATPSPSQQIRQNEFQKYLSKTSPILPMGTQAFREELLQQGQGREGRDQNKDTSASVLHKRFDRQGRTATDRRVRVAAASSSKHGSMGEGCNISSIPTRKFSRRPSRRSNGAMSATSLAEGSVGGVEGMQQLLADLDQHLQNRDLELNDADMVLDPEQMVPSREEESLIEELDRVFSQEGLQAETCRIQSRLNSKSNGKRHIEEEAAPAQSSTTSPSSRREWSRTKSLHSGESGKSNGLDTLRRSGMKKAISLHDLSTETSQQQQQQERLSVVNDSLHSHIECIERECEYSKRPIMTMKRSPSPTKRSILNERQQPPPPVANEKEREQEQDGMMRRSTTSKSKTRSSSSSVSPSKKPSTVIRTPRLGSSRHSVGASQVSCQFSGPAAPFKIPSRVVVPATDNKPRSMSVSKGGTSTQKNVIVIDDSDEELVAKKKSALSAPQRRVSPRKKANNALKREEASPSTNASAATTTLTRCTNSEVSMEVDETTFDTSMDESLLIEALDRAEATQKAATKTVLPDRAMSQRDKSPTSTTCGDESFEMASSDNEALLEAMEAGGW
ncbi:hypothetical protein CBS101457_005902 [Exobasidium rhododendri]|nr:hypothetical protein CBS101457_005902 [Exobasidium rhododendri]